MREVRLTWGCFRRFLATKSPIPFVSHPHVHRVRSGGARPRSTILRSKNFGALRSCKLCALRQACLRLAVNAHAFGCGVMVICSPVAFLTSVRLIRGGYRGAAYSITSRTRIPTRRTVGIYSYLGFHAVKVIFLPHSIPKHKVPAHIS